MDLSRFNSASLRARRMRAQAAEADELADFFAARGESSGLVAAQRARADRLYEAARDLDAGAA